jgi:hypothetical protein
VLLLGVTVGAAPAGAEVLTLGACTAAALRALINGAANGDVLLLPACTIAVAGPAGDDANLSGDFDIAASITLQGVGADATVLDGAGLDRVLDIRPGATVVVADLTVRSGATLGPGGGVLNEGVLTLIDAVLTRNTAAGGGGGVANLGALTVMDSRITENLASAFADDSHGGGIASLGTLTVTRSRVTNNTATGKGGGLFCGGGTATVRDGTLADNVAGSSGGGIDVQVEAGTGATVFVERTTVSGNAAGASGGGLHVFDPNVGTNAVPADGGRIRAGGSGTPGATVTLHNTTIAYNRSGGDGGGVGLQGGTLAMVNSTVARNADAGNQPTGAGGIALSGGALIPRNSVIAENTVGPGTPAADVSGAFLSQNTFIGTVDGNPRLGSLQDNGGPIFTMAPFPGSPLIDTGDNALVAAAGLTTDQRGFPRIVDGDGAGGATVDRGAVEVAAPAGPANVAILFLSHLAPAPSDTVVMGILIRAPGRTILGGAAVFDGFDISAPLVACPLLPGTLISGEQVFTCTFPASVLPPGVHTFSLFLDLDDGTTLSDTATIGG